MTRSLTAPMSLFLALSFLATGCTGVSRNAGSPCRNRGDIIVVDTTHNRMWLCQTDTPVQEFGVAIGFGGRDKREAGDKRTPIGEYPLGTPRASGEGFHRFIPVEYPTENQREQGFTGGDIGIHGPPRGWRWLGSLTTWANWTRGCIAVGTDSEIEAIEHWVNEQHVKKVLIK